MSPTTQHRSIEEGVIGRDYYHIVIIPKKAHPYSGYAVTKSMTFHF